MEAKAAEAAKATPIACWIVGISKRSGASPSPPRSPESTATHPRPTTPTPTTATPTRLSIWSTRPDTPTFAARSIESCRWWTVSASWSMPERGPWPRPSTCCRGPSRQTCPSWSFSTRSIAGCPSTGSSRGTRKSLSRSSWNNWGPPESRLPFPWKTPSFMRRPGTDGSPRTWTSSETLWKVTAVAATTETKTKTMDTAGPPPA
mmetsp:Transcript_16896/g.46412  ORF Transcript_16896/g.46412 Transcript_16896/m.46412 type:complete len:204 (-) Transcript_16896:1696-2307(-)